MENKLIKIITNDNGERLVNARELYEFLENKRQFTDWIRQRIDQYGFVENEDYSISQICEKGHRPRIEFAISLDMAKELSMVENNNKGKEARKYFIKCEKKLRESFQLISAQEEIKGLKSTLEDFKRATEEAKEMYKPSHKMKLDYSKMIRALTNTDEEYDIVKQWVFANLGYTKWEDACIDDKKKIIDTINTVARLLTIKKMEQLSLF
ncbi:antA/AntB antirepressor family protein [Clostridium botulinum]|uniref:antA/AntB antirepressor family protein n=1 Tax=Clostridium botulinum TaxID=1491 RepID=UPI001967F77E